MQLICICTCIRFIHRGRHEIYERNVRVLSPDQEILEASEPENTHSFRWGGTVYNLANLLEQLFMQDPGSNDLQDWFS